MQGYIRSAKSNEIVLGVRERGNEKLKRMEFVSRASSQTKDNMYNERRIKIVVQRQ